MTYYVTFESYIRIGKFIPLGMEIGGVVCVESDLSSAQLSLKFSVSLGILKDPKPLPRTLGYLGRARERHGIPRERLRIPREELRIPKDP